MIRDINNCREVIIGNGDMCTGLCTDYKKLYIYNQTKEMLDETKGKVNLQVKSPFEGLDVRDLPVPSVMLSFTGRNAKEVLEYLIKDLQKIYELL